ncbi:MAG: small multi-drug export protein [Defluviitaleaceae bacterium]|nr:small multi-drug export protein [Defluviitaleaceae bacterium]
MADNIAFGFLSVGLPDDLTVFIVSGLPFMGLRSGVLISAFMGFGVLRTLLVCLAGSLASMPVALTLWRRLIYGMERRRGASHVIRRLKRAVILRNSYVREKVLFALFVLAALPLPFTGVWASSLAAAVLGLDTRLSLMAIAAGTFVCAVLMILLSWVFPALFW